MNLERFIEEAKAIGLLGIMISRCGEEIAHVNLDYECRRNVYSATKSYTALAVGFAVQEGIANHRRGCKGAGESPGFPGAADCRQNPVRSPGT